MAKNAGNEKLMDEYEAKISQLNNEYRQFSKDCGLSMQKKRASVSGFYK
jgi:hypothetical protein